MTESVKFDPGIGNLAVNFNEYINDVYSNIMNLHSPHQKRQKFKLYQNKIQEYMKNNIAFYLGCLMWAYYIHYSNENNSKEIEGNYLLNLTPELIEQYDYSMQVNFMDNYFDSFERDSAYYGGMKILIPDKWKRILSAYNDFLELNKGFIQTKTTADIVLPESVKRLKPNLSDIENIINLSIEKKDLNILFDINNFDL